MPVESELSLPIPLLGVYSLLFGFRLRTRLIHNLFFAASSIDFPASSRSYSVFTIRQIQDALKHARKQLASFQGVRLRHPPPMYVYHTHLFLPSSRFRKEEQHCLQIRYTGPPAQAEFTSPPPSLTSPPFMDIPRT